MRKQLINLLLINLHTPASNEFVLNDFEGDVDKVELPVQLVLALILQYLFVISLSVRWHHHK